MRLQQFFMEKIAKKPYKKYDKPFHAPVVIGGNSNPPAIIVADKTLERINPFLRGSKTLIGRNKTSFTAGLIGAIIGATIGKEIGEHQQKKKVMRRAKHKAEEFFL